jgi:cytochrome c oxidase cbb3-type subunit 1
MSEKTISTPTASCDGGNFSSGDINASCRLPLTPLFMSATGWLLAATVLGFIATLKFHSPEILGNCPWCTYGRVHAASLAAMVYGFGIQISLAITLWVFAQLGRNKISLAPAIIAGWVLLNIGITAGVIGILYGENTGYEWMEMPRYGLCMVFFGYILIAIAALLTFHKRRERAVTVSHWFMVTAIFWFPWVYSTAAYLLLSNNPVRGTLQSAVDYWFINNMTNIVLGFFGLGTVFYFIPKLSRQPLNSHYTALLSFITLVAFGSWGGIPVGTPLPSWMPSLSTMGSMVTLVPAITVLWTVLLTVRGAQVDAEDSKPIRFVFFAAYAYALSVGATAVTSPIWISRMIRFTWFGPAITQLFLFGFLAMAAFGAAYHILPRILGGQFPAKGMIGIHFFLAALGIIIYSIALMTGGIHQGMALSYASQPFQQVMLATLGSLRASTTGELLMAIGNGLFALNLFGLVFKIVKSTAQETVVDLTRKVEVAR